MLASSCTLHLSSPLPLSLSDSFSRSHLLKSHMLLLLIACLCRRPGLLVIQRVRFSLHLHHKRALVSSLQGLFTSLPTISNLLPDLPHYSEPVWANLSLARNFWSVSRHCEHTHRHANTYTYIRSSPRQKGKTGVAVTGVTVTVTPVFPQKFSKC